MKQKLNQKPLRWVVSFQTAVDYPFKFRSYDWHYYFVRFGSVPIRCALPAEVPCPRSVLIVPPSKINITDRLHEPRMPIIYNRFVILNKLFVFTVWLTGTSPNFICLCVCPDFTSYNYVLRLSSIKSKFNNTWWKCCKLGPIDYTCIKNLYKSVKR